MLFQVGLHTFSAALKCVGLPDTSEVKKPVESLFAKRCCCLGCSKAGLTLGDGSLGLHIQMLYRKRLACRTAIHSAMYQCTQEIDKASEYFSSRQSSFLSAPSPMVAVSEK